MSGTDFSRSLEQLEGLEWGEPDSDATEMVKRAYTLAKKPLSLLRPEEIGLAITQQIGFPFILDLAFIHLAADPLFDGGYYPGDVLSALIRADESVWKDRPALKEKLALFYSMAMARPLDDAEAFRESLGVSANHGPAN